MGGEEVGPAGDRTARPRREPGGSRGLPGWEERKDDARRDHLLHVLAEFNRRLKEAEKEIV